MMDRHKLLNLPNLLQLMSLKLCSIKLWMRGIIMTLTWVSADNGCCSCEITAGWDWILLVIVIEGIWSMRLEGVWIVAVAINLDGRAISSTNSTSIIQSMLKSDICYTILCNTPSLLRNCWIWWRIHHWCSDLSYRFCGICWQDSCRICHRSYHQVMHGFLRFPWNGNIQRYKLKIVGFL